MYTRLHDRILKIFSMFILHVNRLARRMHLRPVLPALEKVAREPSLPQPDVFATNTKAPNNGPLYIPGCSPTAATDILKTDERSGEFSSIYPGAMPPDSSWGTSIDHKGVSYTIHPLNSTGLTLEHLWDFYQSTAPDPGPRGKVISVDQVGSLMRSSVFDLGDYDHDGIPDHNNDEDTKFFANGTAGPTNLGE